jgi:hypothetical protein
MLSSASVQRYLPPLAAVFSFPRKGIELSARIDDIINGGEYVVSVVFMHVRETLAEGKWPPAEMAILRGLTGTGITLFETLLAMTKQRHVAPVKQAKLRALLEEYNKLFEDIALFSDDISAEDCFRAACAGDAFSDMNTPEEDAAWRDL